MVKKRDSGNKKQRNVGLNRKRGKREGKEKKKSQEKKKV